MIILSSGPLYHFNGKVLAKNVWFSTLHFFRKGIHMIKDIFDKQTRDTVPSHELKGKFHLSNLDKLVIECIKEIIPSKAFRPLLLGGNTGNGIQPRP